MFNVETAAFGRPSSEARPRKMKGMFALGAEACGRPSLR
jgi:hypothetical protein